MGGGQQSAQQAEEDEAIVTVAHRDGGGATRQDEASVARVVIVVPVAHEPVGSCNADKREEDGEDGEGVGGHRGTLGDGAEVAGEDDTRSGASRLLHRLGKGGQLLGLRAVKRTRGHTPTQK